MRLRNRYSIAILLTMSIVVIGACSKSNEESASNEKAQSKEESIAAPSNSSEKRLNEIDDTKVEVESSDANRELVSEITSNQNSDELVAEETQVENEEGNATADEAANNSQDEVVKENPDFDVDTYLKTNYKIDSTHYVTDTWENDVTGRTEYIVNILPDTEEYSEEITEAFKNGADDERIVTMINTAENLLDELPQINDEIHIESVNWVTFKEDFHITLIQDRDQNTIK
ncbi:hypothetical protein [Terribacillus saccharophilus]|uniref:YusW-like protein n=1 Tax=Terribacillus saccharophilus TaxID=361277 RepID=A0ABX4H0W8_9BACI|nr:hypothetical protein [Terribacillus saccharophilus]PAD36377.1 hypothetical protein CHH56_04645 [Terribacillus saccharophilus]PAD94975.1 hypothetical protein CHH50_15845 [Terribacillus saccharophilus]PAE00782.1 hypothetical protein CHH48_05350 [Terribacillus saccharophilus]